MPKDLTPDSFMAGAQFDTELAPGEEPRFQAWKAKNAPKDSGEDYDLRGAYKDGLQPDPKTGHWPDTYKKPNHPTFSNQSKYAKDAPEKAGSWKGEDYTGPLDPDSFMKGLEEEKKPQRPRGPIPGTGGLTSIPGVGMPIANELAGPPEPPDTRSVLRKSADTFNALMTKASSLAYQTTGDLATFGEGAAGGMVDQARANPGNVKFLGDETIGKFLQGAFHDFAGEMYNTGRIDGLLNKKHDVGFSQAMEKDPSLLLDPEWWAGKVGEATGSMIPFLAIGMAAGPAAAGMVRATGAKGLLAEALTAAGQTTAMSAVELAVDAGSNYKEAIEEYGADPVDARKVMFDTVKNEALPTLGLNFVGLFNPLIKNGLLRAGTGFLSEVAQEPWQGIEQRKALRDNLPGAKDIDVYGPTLDEAALGGLGGAVAGPMLGHITGEGKEAKPPKSQQVAKPGEMDLGSVTDEEIPGEESAPTFFDHLAASEPAPTGAESDFGPIDPSEPAATPQAAHDKLYRGALKILADEGGVKKSGLKNILAATPKQADAIFAQLYADGKIDQTGKAKKESKAEKPAKDVSATTDEQLPEGEPAALPPERLGNKGKLATVRGTEADYQYAVVEASEPNTSNDLNGDPDPNYPAQLQPRDRTRKSSQAQIADLANKASYGQLNDNALPNFGAPVLGQDLNVEAGNGRMNALRLAYDHAKPSAEKYRTELLADAQRLGIDPKTIEGMTQPVLVRLRTSPVDRVQFAREANEDPQQRMSPAEVASIDAPRVGAILDGFNPEGSLRGPSNRDFVRAFMESVVSPSDRATLQTANGQLSKEGERRIHLAVFARAYGDPSAIEALSEDPDSNTRNVTQGMLRAAPKLATVREGIKGGHLFDLDIAPDVAAAARKLSTLKDNGTSVADYLAQENMLGEDLSPEGRVLLQVFDEHGRSSTRIGDILTTFADSVTKAGAPGQAQMFGATTPPNKGELLTAAVRRVLEKEGAKDGLETPRPEDKRVQGSAGPQLDAKERRPAEGPKPSRTEPGRTAAGEVTLPKDLVGAKPRYNHGTKAYALGFAADVDRAAYIIAQDKPSKHDGDYLKFVMSQLGMAAPAARAYGKVVKAEVKKRAAEGRGGTQGKPEELKIPNLRETQASEIKLDDDQVRQMASEADAAKARLKDRLKKFAADERGGLTLFDDQEPDKPGAVDELAEIIHDIAIVGAHAIARGKVAMKEWSAAVIDELGEAVRPYLERAYHEAVGIARGQMGKRPTSKSKGTAREQMSLAEAKAAPAPTPVVELPKEAKPDDDQRNIPEPGGKDAESKPAEAKAEKQKEVTGRDRLVAAIADAIGRGEDIRLKLDRMAEAAFGGTRASGAFDKRTIYEAQEQAVNTWMHQNAEALRDVTFESAAAKLREVLSKLATQTVRDQEQIDRQQFSTPPHIALLVNRLAALRPNDVVLEPSAGTGGLAAMVPDVNGITLHLNEIDPERAAIAQEVTGVKPTQVNAEILDAMLPADVQPTVILMNPPFTSGLGGTKGTDIGFKHLNSALARLADGGRAVVILSGGREGFQGSEGATMFSRVARPFWNAIADRYNIRANVRLAGKEYAKYGTTMPVVVAVVDKTGPTQSERIQVGEFDTVEEAYARIGKELQSRSSSQAAPGATKPASSVAARPDAGRPGNRSLFDEGEGAGEAVRPAGVGNGAGGPTVRPASVPASPRDQPTGGKQPAPAAAQTAKPAAAGSPGGAAAGPAKVGVDRKTNEGGAKEDVGAFVEYRPIVEGPAHPANVVETATMASVEFPPFTYKPALPASIFDGAKISAVQMESVILAGQANETILPDGQRASVLIGDGTGMGKGRTLAAILYDNWLHGRKRLLWVSEKWTLFEDAKRDLIGIGAHELAASMQRQDKYQSHKPIAGNGVLFTVFSTARTETTTKPIVKRIDQLAAWLHADAKGEGGAAVIDEAHNLKNTVAADQGEASDQGIAFRDFNKKLPMLRVTYASATAASEVRNMGYLDRLGLWGPKTAFPGGFNAFQNAIAAGGTSAMELVAREMKAQGRYVSRSISFKGVELLPNKVVELNDDQKALYRSAAEAWRMAANQADRAVDAANGNSRAKKRFLTNFYNAQQRFFNLLLTAMKVPAAIEDAEEALAAGKSVVITLVNTNESTQDREKLKLDAGTDDFDTDGLDFGPREILLTAVRNSFPTTQYEDALIDGKAVKLAVTRKGENGKEIPVENPEAVAIRTALLKKLEAELHLPANPLDLLVDGLGGRSKVAELTGRKQYFDPNTNKFVPRGDKGVPRDRVNIVEAQHFQDGKKRVAVLSGASGTGISLHSDNTAKNQQRRYQITVQPGWSADKTVQMLGRTHRSNQANAPQYRMIQSNLGGESRFISTIAKRLGTLGALTKGSRSAAGASAEAIDKVNFDSAQGRAAAQIFYNTMMSGRVVGGLGGMDILGQMGMLKTNKQGDVDLDRDNLDNVNRLLNRLLSLDPDVQNAAYDIYYDAFEQAVATAEENGTLDTGVKQLPGSNPVIASETPISRDPDSGAETTHVVVETTHKNDRVTRDKAERRLKVQENSAVYRTVNRKGVVSYFIGAPATPIVHAEGKVEQAMYVTRPNSQRTQKTAIAKLGSYEAMQEKAGLDRWEETVATIPETFTQRTDLIGGSVLRWWGVLRDAGIEGIFAVQDEKTGQRVVGVRPADEAVAQVLQQIGSGRAAVSPSQLRSDVTRNGTQYDLEGGLKVVRGTVTREQVVAFRGDPEALRDINQMGVRMESGMAGKTYYVPNDDKGLSLLQRILEKYPIIANVADKLKELASDTSGSAKIPFAGKIDSLFGKDEETAMREDAARDRAGLQRDLMSAQLASPLTKESSKTKLKKAANTGMGDLFADEGPQQSNFLADLWKDESGALTLPKFALPTWAHEAYDWLLKPAGTRVAEQGPAGAALQTQLNRARDLGEVNAGQRIAALGDTPLGKLTRAENFELLDVLEGRATTASTKLMDIVTAVRTIQQGIVNEATAARVLTKQRVVIRPGDPRPASLNKIQIAALDKGRSITAVIRRPFSKRTNYFPHVIPDAERLKGRTQLRTDVLDNLVNMGISTSRANAEAFLDSYVRFLESGQREAIMLRYMVATGQAKDDADAYAKLVRFRKVQVKRQGSLEHAREVNLPFFDPIPARVLPAAFARQSMRLAQIRLLGQDDQFIDRAIKTIRDHGGDAELVKSAVDTMLGKANEPDKKLEKISRRLRIIQGFKLGFAAIPNATQPMNVLLGADLRAFLAGAAGVVSKSGRRFGIESGAAVESVVNETLRYSGAEGEALGKFLKANGFSFTERNNRIFAANAGANYAARLLDRAKADPHARRRLAELLGGDPANAIARGKLSPNEILTAAKRLSDITQFRSRPEDMPLWASSNAGKIFFQFKTFIYGQTRLLHKETIGEMREGNWGRGVRSMLILATVFPLPGLAVEFLRALLTGRDLPDRDPLQLWWDGVSQAGALGVLTDLTQAARYRRLEGWVLGPTFSDAAEIGGRLLMIPQSKDPEKAAKQLGLYLVKQVPFVGRRIAEALK